MVVSVELFARSRDLVVLYRPDGSVVYRNEAASARPPEDAVGRLAREVIATGQPASHEWGEHGPRGVVAWFSTEITPVDGGALAISRDITAIRRREQLMVDTQGVAHLGTWEWDVTQPTAHWSDELYRIYGLTPETYTPSYEQYLTMVHPDDRQRVIDATNRAFHEHVPYSHDERIFRPDGSIRWLHTWAYPVLDGSGKLTHLIGVCQDITDRALIEEQLEHRVHERTTQLQTALRELEAFNSMVSHDLRAPLSVIQMSVDLLAPTVDSSPRGPVYVDRIRRSIRNMTLLMDDLLALARVGQASLQPATVDISALANEIVGELQAADGRNVSITIAPGLACTADPRLFRLALANLLGNAWKYTTRQPDARIEVGRVERAGGVALFVRDNGIGFAPEEATKLFAPFERGKNAVELPGTGIGLAIVQKIVERHGGEITATGELGSGATFYVSLPGAIGA